jgi:hypothetical protein
MYVFLLAAVAAAPTAPDVAPYRSAFAEYRPWRGQEPAVDWKRANDEMKRLGGHAGHLREKAQQPEPPAAAGGHDAHQGARK